MGETYPNLVPIHTQDVAQGQSEAAVHAGHGDDGAKERQHQEKVHKCHGHYTRVPEHRYGEGLSLLFHKQALLKCCHTGPLLAI